jgi:2-desacetyl-2-hydroxyethyl bacteriochlorophyllide A dehydrogenase
VPTRARGVVITGPRRVELESFELPDPDAYQVLVRHTRTLVSAGTEVTGLLDAREDGARRGFPSRPGYSGVGVVEAVGSAVPAVLAVRPGDRVLTRGRHASHVLATVRPFPYAETAGQHALPDLQLQPVPDGVRDEDAVFSVLASVAMHGVRKVAFRPGESCVVVGQGVVGQLLVQLARAGGAAPVIAVDLAPFRLERSLRSGAYAVVDASTEDVEAAVLRLTGGRGADVGFEATRTPTAFPVLLRAAALGGRVVMVGSVHASAEIRLFEDLQRKELTIIGAWHPRAPVMPHHAFPWSQAQNRRVFLEMLGAGTLRVDHLITHRAPPEAAAALYAEMAASPSAWLGVQFVWS